MEAKFKKMTVVELKKELDKYNLSKTGLKAELIQRLMKHLEEQSKTPEESEEPKEEEEQVEDSPIKPAASKRFKRARRVVDSDDEKENKENDEESESKSKTTKAKSKTTRSTKKATKQDDDDEQEEQVEQVKAEPEAPKEVEVVAPVPKEVAPQRKSETEAPSTATISSKPRQPEQKTTLEFVPSLSLYHLANDRIFDRSIEYVLNQVHPTLKVTPPALKSLRGLITFVMESVIKGGAVAILEGRPAITVESSLRVVRSLIGGDLAKHAEAEGTLSVSKYRTAKQQGRVRNSDDDPSAPNDAGLVFPFDLFQNTLKNCCYPTPQVEEECVVLFSAFGEYFSAEILELSGNIAAEERRENITPEHINLAITRDEEFSKLFSTYSNPYTTAKEQEALSQWMNKGRDLIQTLEQLPVEQLAQAIKSITQSMRIMDNLIACREALRQFAQSLPQEIASEVEKVTASLKLEESSCVQQIFGPTVTRTKATSFSISSGSEIFRFGYNNTVYDLNSDDARSKLEMVVSSPRVNGTIWGNAEFGEDYQMSFDILHQLKIALGVNLDDLQLVHLLLIICETDSSGAGLVQSELDTMIEVYHLFDQDQSLNEIEQLEADME